ncbi:four helix bundle protein [Rubrivirga sp.]|uniref:four helix bundle protein n=1 Tax=Rubrivirga sp. TaxID=1885344 RepID=UPI003B5263E0
MPLISGPDPQSERPSLRSAGAQTVPLQGGQLSEPGSGATGRKAGGLGLACARPGEYLQFLRYARGSLYEIETQLRIAARRGYIDPDAVPALLNQSVQISKMLSGLVKSLKAR